MSILGLTGEREKEDNLFKRLFWPSNLPGEVDTLGQQGFWICAVVGLVSGLLLLATGQPLIALLTMAFFWLGGIGVREHSVAAAIFIAVAYIANILINLFALGIPPGVVAILITGLLLANIRGTYIAAAWQKQGALDEFPERMNTTFFDKLVDQLPRRVWPSGRFVFFAVGALYVGLLLLGNLFLMMGAPRRLSRTPVQVTAPVDH